MKYLKVLLLILIPLILWGCPDKDIPFDSTVIFINNSDKTLLDYCRDNYYPDTTIQVQGNVFDDRIKQFAIKPHSVYKMKTSWRHEMKQSHSTGVMTIFLFDQAVVDTVPWDKIREDYLVAKRYEYTLEQLDSLNWTIIYP